MLGGPVTIHFHLAIIFNQMKSAQNKIRCLFLLLAWVMCIDTTNGQTVFWLSNTPPAWRHKTIVSNGMHKISAEPKKRGQTQIVQWLREGSSVELSPYVSAFQTDTSMLFDPDGHSIELLEKTDSLGTEFAFINDKEGFYHLFFRHQSLQSDTLFYSCAYREILNHSCRNGHASELKYIPYRIFPEKVPFQIVRERVKGEDLHYFIKSGESITFKVLLDGQPQKNALLHFYSQKGWYKSSKTDENGSATFEVIEDYFDDWHVFDNDKIQNFIVKANYTIEQPGYLQTEPYQYRSYSATYSEAYRPAKIMYMSGIWGVIVFLTGLAFAALAVFLHRRKYNRLKKYLHEKA